MLYNKLHKFSSSKQLAFFSFLWLEDPGTAQLGPPCRVLRLTAGVFRASFLPIQVHVVLVGLSSLWLQDWGPYSLAGCQLGPLPALKGPRSSLLYGAFAGLLARWLFVSSKPEGGSFFLAPVLCNKLSSRKRLPPHLYCVFGVSTCS